MFTYLTKSWGLEAGWKEGHFLCHCFSFVCKSSDLFNTTTKIIIKQQRQRKWWIFVCHNHCRLACHRKVSLNRSPCLLSQFLHMLMNRFGSLVISLLFISLQNWTLICISLGLTYLLQRSSTVKGDTTCLDIHVVYTFHLTHT